MAHLVVNTLLGTTDLESRWINTTNTSVLGNESVSMLTDPLELVRGPLRTKQLYKQIVLHCIENREAHVEKLLLPNFSLELISYLELKIPPFVRQVAWFPFEKH